MAISSRTPEGQPGGCPVCGEKIRVEPSIFFGDATCPRCGSLIWLVQTSTGTFCFGQERAATVRALVADQLGVPLDALSDATSLKDLGVDSLDIIELAMEIEEEFGDELPR